MKKLAFLLMLAGCTTFAFGQCSGSKKSSLTSAEKKACAKTCSKKKAQANNAGESVFMLASNVQEGKIQDQSQKTELVVLQDL